MLSPPRGQAGHPVRCESGRPPEKRGQEFGPAEFQEVTALPRENVLSSLGHSHG